MADADQHDARQRAVADCNKTSLATEMARTHGDRIRLVAVRREPGTGPHTLVTADLIELRAAPAKSTPAMTGSQSSTAQGR